MLPPFVRSTAKMIPTRAAVMIFALLATATASSAGPFNDFYGTWSGHGNAIFNGGAREALLCKGYYSGEGGDLKLALRCASPSSKIDMRAQLKGSGTEITGTWEERTFNAQGAIDGKLSGQKLHANLTGGITGTLKLSLGSNSQLVSLNTEGSALTMVQLKLKRR